MNPKDEPGSPSGRFAKGKSGNPKGRPKARPASTPSAFDIIIDKKLVVTRGGVERELTVEEALQHKTYQDAIAGNRPARREILKMIAKREKAMAAIAPQPFSKVETRIEPHDPDNADEAMLILGIAIHDTQRQHPGHDRKQLKIEPWAVQLAIKRKRGRSALIDKDIAEIRRCTRNAEALRWPRKSTE